MNQDAPKHVILMSYSPTSKQHERYDALVIGAREMEEHSRPVLNLVHFRHDDPTSHHALMGIDWADTVSRTLDVPHKDDVVNQSFYYLCEGEENPVPTEPPMEELPVEAPCTPDGEPMGDMRWVDGSLGALPPGRSWTAAQPGDDTAPPEPTS